MLLLAALAFLPCAFAGSFANRLRVEYLDSPLTIDVPAPRFSWALQHTDRAQAQTAYHLVVSTAPAAGAPAVVWDTGKVASSTSLNVKYAGAPLVSDTDYAWTLTWFDAAGAASAPASATFSTPLLTPAAWEGAEWVSSPANGSLNTYRTEFTVAARPVRARLYMHGLGYAKTWINGALTDDHELGTFTTFQQRTLYDVVDVTALVKPGCNALGVMLGHGWFSQPKVRAGPRQFRLLLVLTAGDGTTTRLASSNAGGPLVFAAAAGPVVADDIYLGETYDARVAASMAGWAACGFSPAPAWAPTEAPNESPATFGSVISAHGVHIRTDRTYSALAITSPLPGVYVVDFGQNMAGQSEITVEDCPAGTNITLFHNEILNEDGTVNRNLAPMVGTYVCAGTGVETYRTLFTYYGFRYVQVNGWPGVPGEEAVAAHFVHSAVPQSGEFSSSNAMLNAIQHATRFASWSNLMDVPTDCPQRERFGWLGDAQLSFETVIHNVDGGGFYTKWLNDFADTQVFDNITRGTDGALPDCIPYYGHGHESADAGWGIAAWTITDWFSDYYADDVFDVAWYPNMKWYMENWIALAQKNPSGPGLFPLFFWGDWANYVPGPYAFKTPEYPQFFYIRALEITAKFATRLGFSADAAKYSGLATAARALYVSTFYNATSGCFAGCTYVSQVFALTLGLAGPQGSPAERAAWANAMNWWSATATQGIPEHFGGGIISLKYALPLLDAHGESGLALKMHLQEDEAPGFGYWVKVGGATTLWEQYNMDSTHGDASRNHIMFGAAGSWYYSTLAGLGRAPDSRSWQNLTIAPPHAPDVLSQLSWASASIDSPMGLVASSWAAGAAGAPDAACGEVKEKGTLRLTCVDPATGRVGPGVFTAVDFASFGTPSGACPAFQKNASCDGDSTAAIVAALCLGKSACTLNATTDAMNKGKDPCFDTLKTLAVQLSGPQCAAPPLFTVGATVPVGGSAKVRVPAMGAVSSAVIREGSAVVWQAGAFVPGTPGVSGAAASGGVVEFSVGSGAYNFVAFAA